MYISQSKKFLRTLNKCILKAHNLTNIFNVFSSWLFICNGFYSWYLIYVRLFGVRSQVPQGSDHLRFWLRQVAPLTIFCNLPKFSSPQQFMTLFLLMQFYRLRENKTCIENQVKDGQRCNLPQTNLMMLTSLQFLTLHSEQSNVK